MATRDVSNLSKTYHGFHNKHTNCYGMCTTKISNRPKTTKSDLRTVKQLIAGSIVKLTLPRYAKQI